MYRELPPNTDNTILESLGWQRHQRKGIEERHKEVFIEAAQYNQDEDYALLKEYSNEEYTIFYLTGRDSSPVPQLLAWMQGYFTGSPKWEYRTITDSHKVDLPYGWYETV